MPFFLHQTALLGELVWCMELFMISEPRGLELAGAIKLQPTLSSVSSSPRTSWLSSRKLVACDPNIRVCCWAEKMEGPDTDDPVADTYHDLTTADLNRTVALSMTYSPSHRHLHRHNAPRTRCGKRECAQRSRSLCSDRWSWGPGRWCC